jgi:hypothetical protein
MSVTAPAPGVTQATHEASSRRGLSAKSVAGATQPAMFKFLFALAIGIALGYNYGWNDAQINEKAYYERVVDRIGGSNRDLVGNDVDAEMASSGDR